MIRRDAALAFLGVALHPATLFAQPSNDRNETVLVRVAGDDLSATTTIPAIAKRFLISRGAVDVAFARPSAPWTSKLTGRILGGEQVSVEIRASNTGDGIRMLDRGMADIALAARPLRPQELQALGHLGNMRGSSATYLMARVGAAMVVHPSNTLDAITFEQVRAIYDGHLTDWSALGGRAGPIRAYGRAPGSGARDIFEANVYGRTRYGARIHEFGSFGSLRSAMLRDPQAIGYMPVDAMRGLKSVRLRARRRLIPLPDEYGLATGDYPFSLELALFRAPTISNSNVDDFVHEARSITSQVDVIFSGFYRVGSQLLIPRVEDPVPAIYRDFADHSLRVSTTIRFNPGSIAVDPQSSIALDEVAEYLRFLHVSGDKLRLIAFTDDNGSPEKNDAIAHALGNVVAAELQRRRVTPGIVVALGATAPLSSDGSPAGRRLNRRVETWIAPVVDR